MEYLFENGYKIFQMKDIVYDNEEGLHIKGYQIQFLRYNDFQLLSYIDNKNFLYYVTEPCYNENSQF